MAVEHLYLHVPFCGHRCGYCDFVTVTGNRELHGRYVDALIAELDRHAPAPRTIFIGGGTPSLLDDRLLARLLAALPDCEELTVECNPETITPAKARTLVAGGVDPRLVGGAELSAAAAGDARAAGAAAPGGGGGGACCARPVSKTSTST